MDCPEPGIYPGVAFTDYCQWDAVNNSSLGALNRSPLHYQVQEPLSDTEALFFGRLCHAGKLEPESIADRYVVMPQFEKQVRRDDGSEYANPKSSKPYKDLVAKFEAANASKEIVSPQQYADMIGVVGAINGNDRAREYFSPTAVYEASIVWGDSDTGIRCKARCDCWDEQALRITDLKTTQDASTFSRSIERYAYHRQAAFYLDGMRQLGNWAEEFCIVAVEKEKPYGVRAAPMSDQAIREGRRVYKAALRQIAAARQTEHWPGYANPEQWELPGQSKPLELTLNGEVIHL